MWVILMTVWRRTNLEYGQERWWKFIAFEWMSFVSRSECANCHKLEHFPNQQLNREHINHWRNVVDRQGLSNRSQWAAEEFIFIRIKWTWVACDICFQLKSTVFNDTQSCLSFMCFLYVISDQLYCPLHCLNGQLYISASSLHFSVNLPITNLDLATVFKQ